MMMRLLIVALLAVIAVPAARAEVERNGNWWQSLEHNEKLLYTLGLLDGIEFGRLRPLAVNSEEVAKRKAATAGFMRKYVNGISNQQIVDGLDTLYADFKNRRIHIQIGLGLVLLQISGTSPSEIERLLESWRSRSAGQ